MASYQRLSRRHIFTSWSRAWLQRKIKTKVRSQCHPMDIKETKGVPFSSNTHTHTHTHTNCFSYFSPVFHTAECSVVGYL